MKGYHAGNLDTEKSAVLCSGQLLLLVIAIRCSAKVVQAHDHLSEPDQPAHRGIIK
jgi:hypothetical protein